VKKPKSLELDLSRAKVLTTVVPGVGAVAARKLPGRNKYRNVRTEYAGEMYDSKAEAGRAMVLDAGVRSGEILWWLRQVRFTLGVPENVYRPDFLVVTPEGIHAEDVKGAETAKFRRDRKLWTAYGPCDLWIIKGGKVEVVEPKRRES
jgi:hypothetical protein